MLCKMYAIFHPFKDRVVSKCLYCIRLVTILINNWKDNGSCWPTCIPFFKKNYISSLVLLNFKWLLKYQKAKMITVVTKSIASCKRQQDTLEL